MNEAETVIKLSTTRNTQLSIVDKAETPTTMMKRSHQTAAPKPFAAKSAEDDAQEIAGFLLTLKHRSVTPEPQLVDDSSSDPPTIETHAQPQPPAPLRDAMGAVGMPLSYPAVGSVYGFPTAFDPAFLDRTPSMLDDTSSEMPWKLLLDGSDLVLMKDRDLVPDALFVAMAQMKVCHLTQADRVGCYKSRELGFTGMCCKHCGGQPGFGRYYPNSVRSLAQTTTSQTILKHIGSKCRFCPPHVRQAVLELQRQQAAKEGMASGRPRYGSRKIFFQRIWARLHGKRTVFEEDDAKHVEDSSLATASDTEDRHSGSDDSDDDSGVHHRKHSHLPVHKILKRRKDQENRENKKQRLVQL